MTLTDDERAMIAAAATHYGGKGFCPASRVPAAMEPAWADRALALLRAAEASVGAMCDERDARRMHALYRDLVNKLGG